MFCAKVTRRSRYKVSQNPALRALLLTGDHKVFVNSFAYLFIVYLFFRSFVHAWSIFYLVIYEQVSESKNEVITSTINE